MRVLLLTLRAAVAVGKAWEMSKGRRKHSPAFRAKVALEAVKGEEAEKLSPHRALLETKGMIDLPTAS